MEINFSHSRMLGNVEVIKKILIILKQLEDDIDYMNYDAGFHGWEGQALENEYKIQKAFQEWWQHGMLLCEKALKQNDNKKNDKENK